jgi:hypothetical protein
MTSVRFLEAGIDDPDRQMALKITNYVADMPLRRVVAIYSLAITMSLRGIGRNNQAAALSAMEQACAMSWLRDDPEPTGVCGACLGAGTVKTDGSAIRHEQVPPDEQRPCAACSGTGRGR